MTALDALEAKVGILLGLAAVLVALAATLDVPVGWKVASALPAFVAALGCMWALLAKPVEGLDIRKTRDIYLGKPDGFTARRILDWMVSHTELTEKALTRARHAVTVAASLLVASTAINFLLIVIEPT